ncbi:ABC transporter, ATP-binding protein, partial [Teladorsagia circumcincta]
YQIMSKSPPKPLLSVNTARTDSANINTEREGAGRAAVTPRRPKHFKKPYLNKHLGSAGSDEKFTEVVPPTTGIAVPVKSEKTHGSGGKPLKKNIKHLHEELPLEKSALEFMMSSFPDVKEKEDMRKIVGRYGITGREQVCPMKQLSDGQRCRVSFAWLAWQQPHLLLLDEPTNHLDMESIDALAEAINCFSGGMILVSHDFRLVAEEVWVCDNQTIKKWDGDIFSFKEHLRREIDRDARARERGLTKER